MQNQNFIAADIGVVKPSTKTTREVVEFKNVQFPKLNPMQSPEDPPRLFKHESGTPPTVLHRNIALIVVFEL